MLHSHSKEPLQFCFSHNPIDKNGNFVLERGKQNEVSLFIDK